MGASSTSTEGESKARDAIERAENRRIARWYRRREGGTGKGRKRQRHGEGEREGGREEGERQRKIEEGR